MVGATARLAKLDVFHSDHPIHLFVGRVTATACAAAMIAAEVRGVAAAGVGAIAATVAAPPPPLLPPAFAIVPPSRIFRSRSSSVNRTEEAVTSYPCVTPFMSLHCVRSTDWMRNAPTIGGLTRSATTTRPLRTLGSRVEYFSVLIGKLKSVSSACARRRAIACVTIAESDTTYSMTP